MGDLKSRSSGMCIWLMLAAIAFGNESLLAATTPAPSKNPGKGVLAPEALALGELELPQSAGVSELDRLVGVDMPGAFEGERCDELESTIEEQLRLDPSSLSASYFKALCTGSEQSILEYRQTSNDLDLKFKQAELPAGENFGETVISVSSFLDIGIYIVWHGLDVVADYYEIAGGGRRLYLVSTVHDPVNGHETDIRFDLTRVATELLHALVSEADADIREAIEDAPAAVLIGAFAAQPDADPSALIGLATFAANLPNGSWESPEILDLLSRAAENGNSHGQVLLARALLLKEEPSALARAFELATKASESGLAIADVTLCALFEKGVGVAKSGSKARRALKRAADAVGETHAQYMLARVYLTTGSRTYDRKLGLHWLEKAARGGDANAQNDLGVECYAEDSGNPGRRCTKWYEKAASQGVALAMLNLGGNYENGTGVEKDAGKAQLYYRQAMERGLLSAANSLGVLLSRTDDEAGSDARVAALYRTAAEWGAPWGQNNYGVVLRDGTGVARDEAQSVRWFKLGTAQGNPFALLGLAKAYEWGLGVEKDEPSALELYQYAAGKRNTTAMLRLALMVLDGRGTEKDNDRGRKIMLLAADYGNSEAMWRLGEAAQDGTFMEADIELAEQWYRKSANAGDTLGKRRLGFLLTDSEADDKRIEGVSWLLQAADAGDDPAFNALGYVYEHGIGVDTDYAQARAWFLKGEAAGNMYAIYNLGHMNEDGIGQDPDRAVARTYYERASAKGMSLAKCHLGNMLVEGEGGDIDLDRGWALVTEASDEGISMCQLKLGVAYRYGIQSVDNDTEKAIHYLELASGQGLVDAKAQLAEIAMHDNEDDEAIVAQNFATLVELAATGSARAQFLLAETCLLGRPWPRDFECARRNFVLTDAGGFAPGAPNLGLFAQAGIAGPVDLDAAETWFRKAVAQGASASRYELGRLLLKRGKNIQEAIDLLLPSAEEGNPGSAYVLLRYCREHPDCDVAPDKIAALKKQIAELTPRLKNVLAWGLGCDVMSDAEDGRYAVKLIESMPSQEKDKWAVQDTLAAAYARTGDFENAVSAQRRSIDTMPDTETRVQRLILQERLSLYQSGKTWDLPY